MVYKNIKYGNAENVTVIEFGNGSTQVTNGGIDSPGIDQHKGLYFKSAEPHPIGEKDSTAGMSTDDWNPDVVIAFRNKESFDVFYEYVENVRKEFEKESN